MKALKSLTRSVCVGTAILVVGMTGCASHPDRTASGYWSDKMTTRRVKKSLDHASAYKYPNVKVSTYYGIVTVGGFVNTEPQKEHAIDIARGVSGVREVVDNLVIIPMPTGRAPVTRHPDRLETMPSGSQSSAPSSGTNAPSERTTGSESQTR